MSFFSVWFDRVKSESAVDYTQFYVDGGDPQYVSANTQYVRVWLRSARIAEVRRWTKKFHTTVHGQFAYVDRLRGRQEVLAVVAPAKAFEEMDPGHLDRFITVNRLLLGPVPYAGELTMDVALFSVTAEDLAKPYLDLLANLTDTASVAFLGQVKPFVEPLRRGAETLLGDMNRAQLEIGLSRTDTQLKVGNIVVARVAKGTVKPEDLRLDPDCRLVDLAGQPVTGFPYMVLGIEATNQRDDYASIPEIQSGWESVRQAALEGRPVEEVRGRFDQLRRIVWLSPDLIQTDKRRIVESFNREISDAGYDLAPPHEVAALEAMPRTRPLRDAQLILEGMSAPRMAPAEGALEAVAAPESAPGPISMARLQELMADPDIPEADLRRYFVANPETSRPFAPAFIPDPARVEVAAPSDALEGAMMMDWANGLSRMRRQKKFNRREARGDRRPILVSEGDSWFQFPIFLDDVIDQVFEAYNIWSVDAAGDTLQNMVLDDAEYMQALKRHGNDVRAFLFSGGETTSWARTKPADRSSPRSSSRSSRVARPSGISTTRRSPRSCGSSRTATGT